MKKKHDNNNLLRIGDQLFRRQGYHNTGTEEILEKADYPRSSFYYHFKSKEGFGVKTLEYYGSNIRQLLEDNLTNSKVKSPTKRLKNYYYMVAKYQEENKNNNCCLVQRFSLEASSGEEVLQEVAYDQLLSWIDLVNNCVREGQKLGEIRTDMTGKEVGEFLFSMIYGGTTVARLSGDPKELRKKMELAFKLIKA